MQDIIKWLKNLEQYAGNVYLKASEYFIRDKAFSKFLKRSAEDEAWHYHVMVSAADHFSKLDSHFSPITMGEDAKQRIESIFHEIEDKIEDRTLTKNEMLDLLIKAEFSV